MKRKILIATVTVLILAIALTAVLVACKDGGDGGAASEEAQAQRQQSIFALAAVSAGELIGDDQVAQAALAGDVTAIEAELDEYMAMLDSIIGGDQPITSTVAANTNEAYSQYAMAQTITAETAGGVSETYTIYYNETHQPNYDRDDDDDRDEQEDNYRVTGVMVNGENVFDISGWREVSTERNETEESLEFTATNQANGMRMVFELENENESNETGMEFAYSIYDGRSLVRAFEISFEQESGWMGEETEFELFTHENGQSMEYEIESETVAGQERIKITRRAGGPVERYRATRNGDGTYSYEYVGTGTRW